MAQHSIRQNLRTILFSLVLAALLGVVDYMTGHELSVAPFYLLPCCLAGWRSGRAAGIWMAFICATVWLISDLGSGTAYQHGLKVVVYWNALMFLLFFVVVVYLLVAFRDSHHHLEETVQRRTAALQAQIAERKRLEMAKLRAERLAVVGRMAAQVAHEVRNPLGSIALNLDLIIKEIDQLASARGHPPEEGRLLVNEIRAEVRRIRRVIEDYLQFGRLPKPVRRPLRLNDFLDQKLAFMHSEFEQYNVKLRTAFDPSLTTVDADPEQLWQATLNLIRNGLEAISNGGELTVSTRHGDTHVVLQVSDNGRGMTDEQLKQVFTPFFTTKVGGTGLGLASVLQIVTEHGGSVECESAPGKGSAFTVFLPMAGNP